MSRKVEWRETDVKEKDSRVIFALYIWSVGDFAGAKSHRR